MQRRSNILVVVGLAAIIIGAAVVYLITTDSDDGSGAIGAADSVEVVVAKSDLASGTLGDDVLAEGNYELRRVRLADKQPDALTTASQLSNQILAASFPEGEQIRSSGLRARSLLAQQVSVPTGFEAVAVNVDFVAGGAGYVAPGDKVNVYAVITTAGAATQVNEDGTEQKVPLPYSTPRAELLLTNVTVLDVSQQVAPNVNQATSANPSAPQPARSSGSALNVLMALTTLDAEKMILATAVGGNSVYLSRVNDDAAPAAPTTGQDAWTILAEEAIEAFQRAQP